MNEKLREIAVKAQVEHCVSHVRLQEFAELIIRECLDIVSDVGSRKWMGFKGTDTDHCLFRIRQHFGVE